jgi:hypothetical protein
MLSGLLHLVRGVLGLLIKVTVLQRRERSWGRNSLQVVFPEGLGLRVVLAFEPLDVFFVGDVGGEGRGRGAFEEGLELGEDDGNGPAVEADVVVGPDEFNGVLIRV